MRRLASGSQAHNKQQKETRAAVKRLSASWLPESHDLSPRASKSSPVFDESFLSGWHHYGLAACSLEVSLVAHDLPFDEFLEFRRLRDHVFVVFQLLVGTHDAKVDASQVDLARIFRVAVADQREVCAQVICGVLDRVLRPWLVVQQTQLQGCLCLRLLHRRLLVAQIEHLHEMLDGLASVICLRVRLCQQLVGLDLLWTLLRLLGQLQELLTVLDGAVQLALRLINHTDALVALSLDIAVLGTLGHCQTLFEELERHIELVVLQVLIGDHLIDADQVFGNVAGNFDKLSAVGFLKSRFEVLHGRELVEDFLFADAEAAVRQSLTLNVLKLD